MSIESVMPSNHLIPCCPLLLLTSIFPNSRVFSNELALHIRRLKYWSFSISTFNGYLRLISFRIDWFDLPAVQWALKSLLQHHNLKASILWSSTFFMVQLPHPYMTTGKTTDLTNQTLVGKVMSLLFSTLSGLVIAFLPRSNCLLISWLEFRRVLFRSSKEQWNKICPYAHIVGVTTKLWTTFSMTPTRYWHLSHDILLIPQYSPFLAVRCWI